MNLQKELKRAKELSQMKAECYENFNYEGGRYLDNELRTLRQQIKDWTDWDDLELMLKELEA